MADSTELRHAEHFLDVAEAEASRMRGPEQAAALDRLDEDEDNIRVALDWATRHDHEIEARLAAAMSWYWSIRGRFSEAAQRLNSALSNRTEHDVLRARLLIGLGRKSWRTGKVREAHDYFEQAAAASDVASDPETAIAAFNGLGLIARMDDDFPEARRHLLEALRLAEGHEDNWATANALTDLACVEIAADDAAQALDYLTRSLAVLDKGGGDNKMIGHIHMWLGYVGLEQGDWPSARTGLRTGLDILGGISDRLGVATCLECTAGLASALLEPERSVRLASASRELKLRAGAGGSKPFPPRLRERWLEPAEQKVGKDREAELEREGIEMSVEKAMEDAKAFCSN